MASFTFPKPPPSTTAVFAASKEALLQEANEFIGLRMGRIQVKKGAQISMGSAFFYGTTFHMITCAHVVTIESKEENENPIQTSISVSLPSVNRTFPATVVACNHDLDLAVIVLEVPDNSIHNLQSLVLAPECIPGQLSFCGGFSLDKGIQVTDGVITHSRNPFIIVATNITDEGTSGGPCLAIGYQELFGVVKSDFGRSHHRTAIVPYLVVARFFDENKDKIPPIAVTENDL